MSYLLFVLFLILIFAVSFIVTFSFNDHSSMDFHNKVIEFISVVALVVLIPVYYISLNICRDNDYKEKLIYSLTVDGEYPDKECIISGNDTTEIIYHYKVDDSHVVHMKIKK